MKKDKRPAQSGRLPQRPEAYEVGYARPPIKSRFKPGRSGNPNGRPKGSKSVKSLLDLALSAPVLIAEGGKQKVVGQRAALFKSARR